MMDSTFKIATGPLEHPAMDYAFLRQEGIKYLEKVAQAGMAWTDFNAHDPGITILEQLCYAITDLGYRIAFELPDLLANNDGDPYESLYDPAQILTSHPVTLADLRKLALDVEGVKNVWIERAEGSELHYLAEEKSLSLQDDSHESEPVVLKGLYRVSIEKSELTDLDGTVVTREVVRRLHANRNLCEDFGKIEMVDPQLIRVRANIEVGPVDDAEDVLLRIYEKISDYISPSVHFATFDQMLERGKSIDEIFAGPRLEHGFLDAEALQRLERRTAINTSDLIHEIMDVEGVRAVNEIRIAPGTSSSEEASAEETSEAKGQVWSLEVSPDLAPRLNTAESVIALEREQRTIAVTRLSDLDFRSRRGPESAAFRRPVSGWRQVVPPIGRDRRTGNYDSIQHQFPACYGIGAGGLEASAPAQRKAQAKQLKAYLMLFDQLLANCFAQLAHLRDLFSFFGDGARTYFANLIEEPALELEDIHNQDKAARQTRLQRMTDDPHTNAQEPSLPDFGRRNRFLNHLLARFAEEAADYSLVLYGALARQGISVPEKLAKERQALLQNYPRVSSARGIAFNYLTPQGAGKVSGLEKRIRLRLGLAQNETFYLVEHILLRPIKEDGEQLLPFLTSVQTKDPFSLRLSFVFPEDWPHRFALPGDASEKRRFMRFVEQIVYEETPAHLSPTVCWLDDSAMDAFKAAYEDWLNRRREYWAARFGI